MKSYSAWFIRSSVGELEQRAGGQRKLSLLFHPVVDTGSPWLLCNFREGAAPPADDVLWGDVSLTEGRSKTFGEIIYLYADYSPASFVYEHARDGRIVRKLVWFGLLDDEFTPGWLCAQGEPEEWESALFRTEQLTCALEAERARCEERGESDRFPERESEVRRVWRDRAVPARSTVPPGDGTVARLVEKHFGLILPLRTP